MDKLGSSYAVYFSMHFGSYGDYGIESKTKMIEQLKLEINTMVVSSIYNVLNSHGIGAELSYSTFERSLSTIELQKILSID